MLFIDLPMPNKIVLNKKNQRQKINGQNFGTFKYFSILLKIAIFNGYNQQMMGCFFLSSQRLDIIFGCPLELTFTMNAPEHASHLAC